MASSSGDQTEFVMQSASAYSRHSLKLSKECEDFHNSEFIEDLILAIFRTKYFRL